MKRLVHSILELNVKGVVNAAAFHDTKHKNTYVSKVSKLKVTQ